MIINDGLNLYVDMDSYGKQGQAIKEELMAEGYGTLRQGLVVRCMYFDDIDFLFQLRADISIDKTLTPARLMPTMAGSIFDLRRSKPVEFEPKIPIFRFCSLPTKRILDLYYNSKTI